MGGVDCGQGRCHSRGAVKDLSIEHNQGVQGLPRGGGRDLALGDQVGEQALLIHGPEPGQMGLAADVMEIAQDPRAIGLLGMIGVVIRAEDRAHL